MVNMDYETYIDVGIKICQEFVRKHPIRIVGDSHEGRKNAEQIEKDWISRIEDFEFEGKQVNLIIKEEDDRFWVDFAFTYDGEFFPINFKSGAGRTADNISGLKYIRYMIFYDADLDYNIKSISEELLAKNIVELLKNPNNLNLTNRDYFCLAHCTVDDSVKIIPVGQIESNDLNTNPKNLFQANFHTARLTKRDIKEMVEFIIKKFLEYQKKRATSFLLFQDADFEEEYKIKLGDI